MGPAETHEQDDVVKRQEQDVQRCSQCKVASCGVPLWATRSCVAAMVFGAGLGMHVTLGLVRGVMARDGVSAASCDISSG
jgi:hypothetical protein